MSGAYSRRAQPFIDAFVLALFRDASLRRQVFSATRYAEMYAVTVSLDAEQAKARPGTAQPFYSNYFCGRDSRCTCRIEDSRSLESDAIVLVSNAELRRCAIHIEVKCEGEPFKFGQPESYPLRAACWAGGSYRPPKLPQHDDWLTVCIHGANLNGHPGLASFDRTFTHAELERAIPGYPAA